MKNFLNSQSYYLKNDSIFRGISYLLLSASIVFIIWIWSVSGFDIDNPIEPIKSISTVSILLYFIIPIHACVFSTEGFEYGSVKNIISSGHSRFIYCIGKFLSEIKVILWWIIQFFGVYYLLYMIAVLITDSNIGNEGFKSDLIHVFSTLGFNFLYLSAYSAIIMMISIIIRNTATSSIITFLIMFGDMMLSSYLKDSNSAFLQMIAKNTLMTQVMKFTGLYIVNLKPVILSSINDYIYTITIPIILIIASLATSIVIFQRRDI